MRTSRISEAVSHRFRGFARYGSSSHKGVDFLGWVPLESGRGKLIALEPFKSRSAGRFHGRPFFGYPIEEGHAAKLEFGQNVLRFPMVDRRVICTIAKQRLQSRDQVLRVDVGGLSRLR